MSLSSLDIPDHCRSFYDPEKTRKWLADTAIEGFNHALNKINSPGYKLHVKDIHIPEGKGNFSLKEQKQAIMDKGDLTLPIKGTFQLTWPEFSKLQIVEAKEFQVCAAD